MHLAGVLGKGKLSHLGRQPPRVVGCTTQVVRRETLSVCQGKVRDFAVPALVDKDGTRLQVPVDYGR
jgi:hypothetical protein